MIDASVEGDGQAARGIVFAAEGFGDGCAAGLARIPGFEKRVRVLLSPIDGEGAAVEQNDDHGLAGFGDGFEQFLLNVGQGDVSAVSAGEALGVDAHLFALKARGEADERDHGVGFFCGFDGLVLKEFMARAPFEGEARAVDAGGLGVLDAQVVGASVGERNGEVLDGSVVTAGGRKLVGGLGLAGRRARVVCRRDRWRISPCPAWIAKRQADLKVVSLGDRGSDSAGPANGEGLSGGVGGLDGVRECPVEVDFLVDADHVGCAVETGMREVLAFQAVYGGVAGGAKHRAWNGELATRDVGRTLGIEDVIVAEFLLNAVDGKNGMERGGVVVALKRDARAGERSNDGDGLVFRRDGVGGSGFRSSAEPSTRGRRGGRARRAPVS